jgi:3-oxo-5alpha-steroid 4-dehydrogenase
MTRETIEPIEPIEAATVTGWDGETDVVVVGLGCAGACAAIEAAEGGADVVVLEAAAMGGGTSAMSGGLIYLGGGTPVQKACGYTDTAEDMERFLLAACGPDAPADKVHAYAHGSVGHYHWLVDHGVPFEGRFHPEPSREPPDDSGLVFSGGEDSWPFIDIAPPVPRGHHPKFPDAAGGFLMQRLIGAVKHTSARVQTDAVAERLVVDGGAVVGVEATVDGTARTIRARRGVVLTAGGFIFNRELVQQHCPAALRCNMPIGNPFDDGRGITMGVGAGAHVVGLDRIEVGIPFTPPRSLVRGIVVNAAGERFLNEDTYAGRLGQEFLLRQDGQVYFVHDDTTFAVNIAGYTAKWVAETAAELEQQIGLPDGSLQRTLDRYNEFARRGVDPDFHKATEWVTPLEPPYGVVDLRVEESFYAPFTLGGLATDAASRVLDGDGEAIPGLFAAGRTTAGIAAGGYVSGISLGDGTFFGRRAGAGAAGSEDG